MIAGIDEAGRGAFMGPLAMAIVVVEDEAILKKMGVKDSKLLSAQKREELQKEILTSVHFHKTITYSAQKINTLMSQGTNLNMIEAKMTAELLDALPQTCKVILDCPSKNIEGYVDEVQRRARSTHDIKATFKADLLYPVVGAASILAKVERDAHIEDIQESYTENIGSGYPSDPSSKVFLHKHANTCTELRTHWKTVKEAQKANSQRSLI